MRLPFFYGWVVVAVAFVTMAVGVNARTAFVASLLDHVRPSDDELSKFGEPDYVIFNGGGAMDTVESDQPRSQPGHSGCPPVITTRYGFTVARPWAWRS